IRWHSAHISYNNNIGLGICHTSVHELAVCLNLHLGSDYSSFACACRIISASVLASSTTSIICSASAFSLTKRHLSLECLLKRGICSSTQSVFMRHKRRTQFIYREL